MTPTDRQRTHLGPDAVERLRREIVEYKGVLSASGLTMESIARRINVAPSTLSTWLRGDRIPRADLVDAALRIAGRPAEDAAHWQRRFERAAAGGTRPAWLTGRRAAALLATGGAALGATGFAAGLGYDQPAAHPSPPAQQATAPTQQTAAAGRDGGQRSKTSEPSRTVTAVAFADTPAYAHPASAGRPADVVRGGTRLEVRCRSVVHTTVTYRDPASADDVADTSVASWLRLAGKPRWVRGSELRFDGDAADTVPTCETESAAVWLAAKDPGTGARAGAVPAARAGAPRRDPSPRPAALHDTARQVRGATAALVATAVAAPTRAIGHALAVTVHPAPYAAAHARPDAAPILDVTLLGA